MLKDTILTVNVVEPDLVAAVKRHSARLGRELQGLVLVEQSYADHPDRRRDTTGLFTEIICDFNDPQTLQAALTPYQLRLLAATVSHEFTIQPFRKLLPFLPYIPTPSESALLWSTEKHMMRDRMREYDPDLVPRYVHVEEHDMPRIDERIREMTFPVIVKPSWLAESLLVRRCANREELITCLKETFQVIHDIYTRERREREPSVLIEEMIEGNMYSIDAYVQTDGRVTCLPPVRVITSHMLGLPGFYSYRLTVPDAELNATDCTQAYATTEAAIHALNLSSTSCHAELFHTDHGWKMIEVGARIGGYRHIMYKAAYGIDHWYNDLAVRMGEAPLDLPDKPVGNAAGFCIYPEQEGIITAIEGVEAAKRQVKSILLLEVRAKPGDKALFSQNGGLPIIDGELGGPDADQLQHDLMLIRKLITIHVSPKKPTRPNL